MGHITFKEFNSLHSHQREERLILGKDFLIIESDRTITYRKLLIPNFEYVYLDNTGVGHTYQMIIIIRSDDEPFVMIADFPRTFTNEDYNDMIDYLERHNFLPSYFRR